MGRPRLLDLFCGAGGAAKGYHDAGFDVVGVDIEPQPRYPYEFHQADALTYPLDGFDVIHASPVCKSETPLRHRTGLDYADFVTPMLDRLADERRPWVVENVSATTKLPGSLVLCGSEFGLGAAGRVLRRHRRFASNMLLMGAGGCHCAGHPIGGVYGGGGGQMTRGYAFHAGPAAEALGIDWMTRDELSQAIPPAYTRFIGEQLLTALVAS